MSRTRALRDPYWATALGSMTPAGQRLARGIHALIRRSTALSPYLWVGSGWRPGGSGDEHARGLALDVIAGENIGIRVRLAEPAAYAALNRLVYEVLVPNAKALGIRHMLWDRKIYRTRYAAWGPLPGRTSSSSIGDWHEDHLHILLEPWAVGWLSRLDQITLRATSIPTAPKSSTTPSTTTSGGLTMSEAAAIKSDTEYIREQLRAIATGTYSRDALNARNADIAKIVKAATDAQSRVLLDAFGKLGVSTVDLNALKAEVRKAVADAMDGATLEIKAGQ